MGTLDADMIALIDQRIRAQQATTQAVGTCVQRATTGAGADVVFDGSTVAMPVKVLGHVFLQENYRCVLQKFGSDWVVTGSWAGLALGEAWMGLDGPVGGTGTLTSASYLDITEFPPILFRKAYDNTIVRIGLSVGAFCNSTNTVVRWAVRLTPTDSSNPYTPVDYTATQVVFNVAAMHVNSTGLTRNSGIPAGEYSCQIRWRRTVGIGGTNSNESDLYQLQLDENFQQNSPFI